MRYTFLRFPENREKAVTFSYDDGVKSDLRLAETVEKYGIKTTFNICSARIGESDYNLNEDDIKDLISRGHEIAVHGKYHKASGKQRAVEGIRDVLDCRVELEERFGLIVRGMAYPDSGIGVFSNGAEYSNIKQYLTDLDIIYARTTANDKSFSIPRDWLAWAPTAHHNDPEIFGLAEKFFTKNDERRIAHNDAQLFYLWGHSFEFDRENNWDRLDAICEKIGNRDDIWYATNGEIYSYVTAYRNLIRSADGRTVYNPSLFTVWFWCDGTSYSVKSGETVKIAE